MIIFLHDLNIGLDIKQVLSRFFSLPDVLLLIFFPPLSTQLKAQIHRFEKSADAPTDGVVTFDVFTQFFEKLSIRPEVSDFIQKYKEEGDEEGSLGVEGLRKFLIKEQGFDGTWAVTPFFLNFFFSVLFLFAHSL